MSISPIDTQDSTSSSSSAPPQSSSSHHGLVQPSELLRSPTSDSDQIQTLGSLSIASSEQSSLGLSTATSGSVEPATADSGGSSEKVSGIAKPYGKKTWSRKYAGYSHHNVGAGHPQFREELPGPVASPQGQQTVGSTSIHGSPPHSAGRKSQMMNGNHLLNFHYDPISRPQPRALPPPRRQQRRKPYNKDLFLQANYKFVVLDTGNYSPESMDPDKMLEWEDIICVKYSTPLPVQCPICLEHPLCPQITSCGHIFCFPCILRYLLMGMEDHKGDFRKKCPLCFMLISPKDLYTIDIEYVKQYTVGDNVQFVLLTRQKESFTPSQADTTILSSDDKIHDSFSKLTFTSDVDMSVRKAISDLDGWLARADSGLVDELEKLPYVCAAMEQLERRKKYWDEHLICNSDVKTHKYTNSDCQIESHVLTANANTKGTESLVPRADGGKISEGQDLSSSYDGEKSLKRQSNDYGHMNEDSYNFYQVIDGQRLILHPLNMKCLLHHYGSYEKLPHRISGRILQLETVTQSEAMRRRYRYLSHFSLTTTFQLCEIDLSEILPPDALSPFMDEIKKREKQRKRITKKDREEKIKAEAASVHSIPLPCSFGQSSRDEFCFSMDDFEALGNSTTASTNPPMISERQLFSNVTKFGFAAGHDSPALKIEDDRELRVTNTRNGASSVTGGPSFANILSRAKLAESSENLPKTNDNGKKGKKTNRVLLSTSGGRRY